jgi:hypothetical protein
MKKVLLYFIAGLVFGIASVSGGLLAGRDQGWMDIYMGSTFMPGDKIAASISGREIPGNQIELTILRIDLEELIGASSDNNYAGNLNDLKLKKLEKVKSWPVKIDKKDQNDNWINKQVEFDNPGTGTYIIQAKAGDIYRTRMFMVTSIAAVSKGDSGRMVVFVADRKTGAALEGAKVSIMKDKNWTRTNTDADGVAKFAGDFSGQFPIVIIWKDNPAAINAYFYGGGNDRNMVYTYTDRPIYRPNQTVRFRGIIRAKGEADYKLPADKNVKVIIRDPRGNEVSKMDAQMSEFGSYAAEYKLGDEPPLGVYSVITQYNNSDYYSDFSVEEYRKPEYEISVTPEKGVYVQGDPLKFTISARYYFGEPVAKAAVSYTIYRRPIYWYWWESGPYPWYFKSRGYEPSYGYNGEQAASGHGTTDGKGMMTVTYGDTKSDNEMTYMLVARVMDQSRREVSSMGSVNVYRGGIRLFVRADRYVAAPGEKVWIETTTKDIQDNPVSRAVNLKINKITWDDKYNRKETKIFEKTVETSPEGAAKTEYTPDEEGYFEIVETVKDDRGNAITAGATFYVVKGGSFYSYYSGGGIELLLDKDVYKPGDEAKLLVRSQLGDVPALITIEGGRLMDAVVLRLKNGAGFYTFKITREFQPNADIGLTVIKDNRLNQQSVPLIAPPEDKFLNVTIESDKEIYKPGDTAHVKVTVKNSAGEPADTELSLGVVDESIYAVKPESTQDIREYFYGQRGNNVSTNSSFWFYSYGNEAVQRSAEMAAPEAAVMAMDVGGRAGGARSKAARAELVEPEIRSDFPDTAYWRAQVRTGAGGIANADFTMPDTLTTWRLTSRGVTLDTSVGETRYKVISKKNVIIRLETPRFFTQNDRVAVTAVIHNYLSAKKDVRAVLNVKGLRLLESNTKELVVPEGGEKRVEWSAVAESPQSAWITAKALTDEESDAMQLTIPVLPHGSPGGDAAAGQVAEKSEFTLNLPMKSIPGTEKMKITLAPSLTSGMFDVFEYLADYPYGCVEQTMSRFLPDVVVTEALQRAGRRPEGKLKELPKMVQDGLDKLADMQHGDGGWGWWKTDDTDPYMTAYVIFGLTMARRADYSVPQTMYDRGVEALKNLLKKTDDSNTKAYMLFALAEAGAADSKQLGKAFAMRKKLSDYGKSSLAIACAKLGVKDCAAGLAKDLSASALVTKTSARWEAKTFKYTWTDNPVETTAFALMALIEAAPSNPLISKAVMYLNTARRGDHWYSTKDTALAVMALTKYMSKYEELKPDYDYEVIVNGKTVKSGHIGEKDAAGTGVSIEDAGFAPGDNRIIVKKKGKGSLYYFASLNYFESAEYLKARDNGIKVERWYSWDAEGKKKIRDGTKLRSGDIIWSQVRVQPRSAYDYVMVENYLPSGFEVDKTKWGDDWYGYWANRELRDEKIVFFITYMWGNEYNARVPLRAETPGVISAMPCVASLMYFPDVGGRSGEARFIVNP